MSRLLKSFACIGLLASGLQAGYAFSLLGPFNEAWQVRDLGFNIGERGDLGGPKNIGEEYRRNVPVLYYAFDSSFLTFFGDRGAAEVDKAFDLLNNILSTNVSSWSSDLSEWPLEANRSNYRAAALRLWDLRSRTLSLMLEQLGLADPVRYVWAIHDRSVGGTCPIGNEYFVTMRNLEFDPLAPDQVNYSSYINGVFYTYYIAEYCATPPFGSGASEAIFYPVDNFLTASRFAPVASFSDSSLAFGGFYRGLTRDDIAGLRYLLRAGNVNWEDVPTNSTVYATNNAPGALQLVVSSNLTQLANQALVTDPATLQTLFPGLVVTSSSNWWANVWVTNVTAYFTNYPYDPIGTVPALVFATNRTLTVQQFWRHLFANIVSVQFTSNNWVTAPITDLLLFTNRDIVTFQTVNVVATADPYAPIGTFTLSTNVTSRSFITNQVVGEYLILPPGACEVAIVAPQLTFTSAITNIITQATNTVTVGNTNQVANTNLANVSFTQQIIEYSTNHYFVIKPVLCLASEPSLRRGVESIRFVRRNFDSLLGQFYYPETNYFTITQVTNSADRVETYQRIITAPDFLFTGTDMVPGPADPARYVISGRTINFNSSRVTAGRFGPGNIDAPSQITFNVSGPVNFNESTNNAWYLDQRWAFRRGTWGSFDDSTNAPVVYPDTVSLQDLENRVIMQVTTNTFTCQVGTLYTGPTALQLTGTGGQPPYIWTLTPGSADLPDGLQLASDGSGVITGQPTTEGIYDLVVRMTDINGNYADWEVTISVSP